MKSPEPLGLHVPSHLTTSAGARGDTMSGAGNGPVLDGDAAVFDGDAAVLLGEGAVLDGEAAPSDTFGDASQVTWWALGHCQSRVILQPTGIMCFLKSLRSEIVKHAPGF